MVGDDNWSNYAVDSLVFAILENAEVLDGFCGTAEQLAKLLQARDPNLRDLPQRRALTTRLREITGSLEREDVYLTESQRKDRPWFEITIVHQTPGVKRRDGNRLLVNLANVQEMDGKGHRID